MSDTAVKKSTKPEKKKKQPVSRKEMTRWQYTKSEMKRTKAGYFMIAPFMIMFLVFTVVPVVLSLLLSFTSFNMLRNFIQSSSSEKMILLSEPLCII